MTNSSINSNSRELKIDERFGVKMDLGYDITDNFSLYATGGYGAVHYKATNFYYSSTSTFNRSKTGITGGAFFGGGLKIDLSQSISLISEFNIQHLNIGTATSVPGDIDQHVGDYKTRIYLGKIGLSYKF